MPSFDATNGASPSAPPVQGANGNFYGTTSVGGHSWGTVFEMTPGGSLTILHKFTGGKDGGDSYAGLLKASNGNLYGTTSSGGPNCAPNILCGTVFAVNAAGHVSTIYGFCAQTNSQEICLDGKAPYTPLVEGTNQHFYGTTASGGAHNDGTVFEITSGGKLTTLYSFCSQPKCVDGESPYGGLVQATDGWLYGTTSAGGKGSNGTVFAVSRAGQFRRVYDFCSQTNCADGAIPYGSLVQAANGNFYGTTSVGGTSAYCPVAGCGTVFELTPKGVLTTLYNFCSQPNCADGYSPPAGLTLGSDGNFYGTTTQGGANVYGGTIFEVTPTGSETTMYDFTPTDGGSQGLFQGTDRNFYGTTGYGGGGGTNQCHNGCGTVFSISLGLGPLVGARPGPYSAIKNAGR